MRNSLACFVDKLQHKKIMVIGDMVADIYLEGRISRISREAPVLVLEHSGETLVPGGAANAVYNAASLGGDVYAVGVIGGDQAGEGLVSCFKDKGIHTQGLVVDAGRPTITKTRILAGGLATVRQQVVRIDREDKNPISKATEGRLLDFLHSYLFQMDAVVLSDYGSGTLSLAVRRHIIDTCHDKKIPCMVDSRYDILGFPGVTFVKQNETEAASVLGLSSLDKQTLPRAGQTLLEQLAAKGVLITQGAEGMTLFTDDGAVKHIPVTNKSEVYDVTGAGDTAVVTMMLAYSAGADALTAASLSNYAAGVVVRKHGTATLTARELKEAIGDCHEDC